MIPFAQNAGVFEVHQILLPMHGIHILENIATKEMVQDKAWESFFTLGPARITGAVQAIINPIAIQVTASVSSTDAVPEACFARSTMSWHPVAQ